MGKLSTENQDDLQRIFRRKGINLTYQRLEIFREIKKAEDHPSAEEVFKRVRPRIPTITLNTVYRTLDTFERLGIVSKVEVLDDYSRFDPNMEPHHHAVCTHCKAIMDFSWPEINEMKPPAGIEDWGEVSSSHMELRGVCSDCLKKGVEP